MSVNGNQKTQPNKASNRTIEALVSPISTDEMAEFIGLPLPLTVSDEALLEGLTLASCQFYIDLTNNELLEREYTFRSDSYPSRQESFSGLGRMASAQVFWINFPLWPVGSVESVTVEDVLLTVDDDYSSDLFSKPARLKLVETIIDQLVVVYKSGYATASEIPPTALTGIKLLTAYMYEHRGACDVVQAAKQSGAASMWNTQKMYLNL